MVAVAIRITVCDDTVQVETGLWCDADRSVGVALSVQLKPSAVERVEVACTFYIVVITIIAAVSGASIVNTFNVPARLITDRSAEVGEASAFNEVSSVTVRDVTVVAEVIGSVVATLRTVAISGWPSGREAMVVDSVAAAVVGIVVAVATDVSAVNGQAGCTTELVRSVPVAATFHTVLGRRR